MRNSLLFVDNSPHGRVSLSLLAMLVMNPATATFAHGSSGSLRPRAAHRRASPVSAREMVEELRSAGLPVTAIADFSRVERKTIYSWLDGHGARDSLVDRLAMIHNVLLRPEGPIDLRHLYRFQTRPVLGGLTLKGLLTAEAVNTAEVRSVIDALRPAVEQAARVSSNRTSARPSGLLGEGLEVGLFA